MHQLIDIVAKGGNLLLNIGPTADGRIPVIMQQRLSDIGGWLKVNGEGIYGSRKWEGSPQYNKETQLFFTKKDKDLFAIMRKWADVITIKNVAKPLKINLLGFKSEIKFTHKNNTLTIIAPQVNPNTVPCLYAWTYQIVGSL